MSLDSVFSEVPGGSSGQVCSGSGWQRSPSASPSGGPAVHHPPKEGAGWLPCEMTDARHLQVVAGRCRGHGDVGRGKDACHSRSPREAAATRQLPEVASVTFNLHSKKRRRRSNNRSEENQYLSPYKKFYWRLDRGLGELGMMQAENVLISTEQIFSNDRTVP